MTGRRVYVAIDPTDPPTDGEAVVYQASSDSYIGGSAGGGDYMSDGSVDMAGSIVFDTDSTYDIAEIAVRAANVYADNLDAPALTLGDATITDDGSDGIRFSTGTGFTAGIRWTIDSSGVIVPGAGLLNIGEDGNEVGHIYVTDLDVTGTLTGIDYSDVGAAASGHDHDADYAAIGHDHNADYSAIGHDHDADYSAIGHNHDASYSAIGHDHDADYEAAGAVSAHTGDADDAHDASAISVLDTAGHFDATDVEAALAEAYDDFEAHSHDSDYEPLGSIPAGSITMYGAAAAPTGWLLCDGSAVSRATYATLFGVIGVTYGAGDSTTTFNLPNLKSRFPVGLDSSDASWDALGETGGAKTHTHAGHSDHSSLSHSGTAVGDHSSLSHSGGAIANESSHQHWSSGTTNASNYDTMAAASGGAGSPNLPTHTHTYGNWTGAGSAHSHTFTQPSAHTVSAHSVTQPSAHTISAHSAHDSPSSVPPYLALNFIIKT